MPASILNAAPTAVLPPHLCTAFSHSRAYPVLVNEYRDGEVQRSLQAETSRKQWTQTRRLSTSELSELRAFYFARSGPTEPFYFYDPFETTPKFYYDPTGGSETGRYVVRFDCAWQEETGMAYSTVPITLVQLA
jgi:hypothetical protein